MNSLGKILSEPAYILPLTKISRKTAINDIIRFQNITGFQMWKITKLYFDKDEINDAIVSYEIFLSYF